MTAKVTLSFSDETIEEARRFAKREGMSLSAWIDQAAREKALREVFAAHAAAVGRAGLVISSDVYNSTDVPIVIVAEVVQEELLRDSPLAVAMSGYVVMPDRLSSPMKKWFTEC